MNINRLNANRIRGLKAKRSGAEWENILVTAAQRCGCRVIPIPPGCRWVAAGKAIAVKTPFDFVIIKNGRSIFIDAKSTSHIYWRCSDNDPDQLKWLRECAMGGARAGYIVRFSKLKVVVFFSVERLLTMRSGESLKPEQGHQLPCDFDRLELGALFYERNEAETKIIEKHFSG